MGAKPCRKERVPGWHIVHARENHDDGIAERRKNFSCKAISSSGGTTELGRHKTAQIFKGGTGAAQNQKGFTGIFRKP
ncbi:MAG: hypothetical protein IJU37_06570, partial [Desulfovibrio sp.]|nr:hypothetical protein [Desulfovibrio sp.]